MPEWLSRLFRRTPARPAFEPRNHLERLLMKAAADPAIRPEFLRAFLDSDLCVIGRVEGRERPGQEEAFVTREGDTLQFRYSTYEGRQVLPVFTSPERVGEYVREESSYVRMNARTLLENIGAQDLLLNPGSAFGKHFVADEVRALLDGSAFRPGEPWKAQQDEQFLIGKPAKMPERFIAALRTYFARRNDVRRAYIAMVHIPSRGDAPNLFLALEVDGDRAPIVADCGRIAIDTLDPGEFVDIGEVSLARDYFARDTPIYER